MRFTFRRHALAHFGRKTLGGGDGANLRKHSPQICLRALVGNLSVLKKERPDVSLFIVSPSNFPVFRIISLISSSVTASFFVVVAVSSQNPEIFKSFVSYFSFI